MLCNFPKIFEKIVKSRLIIFFRTKKLLFKNQFGFRQGLSTTRALYRTTQFIYQKLDNNEKVTAVYLDLAKAFAYNRNTTICSYVPKIKNKLVVLLSSMHMTGEVEETQSAKPEIIKYNKTKDGVDTMDKMLSEYTVKQ